MSRSNYDKPFYVDVGTSVVAIRCASNRDVVCRRDHIIHPSSIKLMEDACDRMNMEFELSAKRLSESEYMRSDWSVKDALNFANTLANHGWTRGGNADVASSCIYALCRMLKDGGNSAAMRAALKNLTRFEESDIRQLETLAQRAIDNDIYGGGILQAIIEAIREGKKALAEPPRNCDRFADYQSALNCFALVECHSDFTMGKFARWLFATATERKGEGK